MRHRRDTCEALVLAGAAAASAVSSVLPPEASGGARRGLEKYMTSKLGDFSRAHASSAQAS